MKSQLLYLLAASAGIAAELHVPREFSDLSKAVAEAKPGDVVLVAPGTYTGPLQLKPNVVVRSAGNDDKGKIGLKRAEATILEGTVEMAEKAVLDGFTVTGVGKYDEEVWKHHFETRGNEQPHEHIGAPGKPGVSASVDCEVRNNIVHHIGYTGIGITGGAPRIVGNICFRNMGGGIGAMRGSQPVIEKNECFENFYAGIGCEGSSPLIRGNLCHHNIRAGIGISEGSSPTVTDNTCFQNRRAGIGIRTGENTRPLVENNECRENGMAGIGVEEGAQPTLAKNRLINNTLVGIGVIGGSSAVITDNDISRESGMPPMIVVLDRSSAVISGNRVQSAGVAGVLVKGKAEIRDNHFIGTGPKAGHAIWIHAGASATHGGNRMKGWRNNITAAPNANVGEIPNR
ncbi:MAG: right-handed parallel beta-helix repeat-containing protein [Prosthecobacter sp.]